jgi:hypothetical protein
LTPFLAFLLAVDEAQQAEAAQMMTAIHSFRLENLGTIHSATAEASDLLNWLRAVC